MAEVNVTSSNAADVSKAVAPRVERAVEAGAAPRQEVRVEAEAPARAEVARGRHFAQTAAPASNESFLAESASRNLGTLAQGTTQPTRRESAQPETRTGAEAQPRQGRHFAEMAGLAGTTPQPVATGEQAQSAAQGGIPVLDVSQVSSVGTESSRSGDIDPLVKALVNEQLGEVRDVPQPTAAATTTSEAVEETARDIRQKSENVARRVTSAASTDTPATSAAVGTDRPNSIWNRSFGWAPKGQTSGPRFRQASTRRSSNVIDKIMERMKNAFSNSGVGHHIYGKMLAMVTLDFRDVGVGIQEITDAMTQDPTMLDRLLAPYLDGGSAAAMSANEIAELVNSNEVYVATFKSPDNRGQDIQRRRLRVLTNERRGIYLHPVMAAMYTADFDGDDMAISFDPAVAELAKDPMDYMVGIDDQHSLNTDFLPVAPLVDLENMTARDYVRTIILGQFSQIDGRKMVDAIMELGDSAHANGDAQANAWSKIFRTARETANSMHPEDKAASDELMSDLCQAVYKGMYDVKRQVAYSSAGVDIVSMQDLPTPRSYSDQAIYKVLDGIVSGEVPNNFQDLKLAMNGFLGNVGGKNAPFRFTADVGKMLKMDSRLKIGDGSFYVDPDNEEQMGLFFESTMKYAESYRMMREIKKAGRAQYYTQLMRDLVIKDVGFPEKYGSYHEFLDAFAESYSRHSAIINEANLVYLTDMGIASDSNRGIVSPLNATPGTVTLGDIAEPMISIYGTYSVGRMFKNLSTSGVMSDANQDTLWSGNPNKQGRKPRPIEREYDYVGDEARFWVTGKYLGYSIRQFKNENRLLRGDSGLDDEYEGKRLKKRGIRNTRISSLEGESDVDVEFKMLLAIADKRTGAASKFNEQNYGMEKTDKNGNKYIDYEGTTVKMQAELLTELDRLDKQGSAITPGYYAGIGSRETPPDVQAAMTRVAQKLSKNWVMRSGHADGADKAFEAGAGANAEIYLPKAGWGGAPLANGRMIQFGDMSDSDQAAANDSVSRYHPIGDRLDKEGFAYKAHRRNYFQVMGTNGAPNSAFVACWTPVGDDQSHGTDQALRIAKAQGIPVFNAAEYDDLSKWEEDVLAAAAAAETGNLRKFSSADQMLWVDDVVQVLADSSPDMFMHFGMDNTAGFLRSKWARKMVEHRNDPEVLGGIRTAMVFDYRMERIQSLLSEMTDPFDDVYKWMDDVSNLQFAKDELASASEVWRGIMSEFMAEASEGQESVFQQMRKNASMAVNRRLLQQSVDGGRLYNWDVEYDAKDFWSNPGEHTTLRSVIEDLDMDRQTKWNVITDVVRYWENDAYLKSYEIGYQLEIGNDTSYDLVSGAAQSATATHRDFEKSFNRWGDLCQRKLQDDVDEAYRKYNKPEKRGYLMNTLQRLDSHPWETIAVNDLMYADSIMSAKDKNYAQTEKGSQHPWTNAVYSALSTQRNGGFMNDVTRTDDRMIGIQSTSSLGIQDVIHILADPTASLSLYNEYGEKTLLTRDLLLQDALGRPVGADVESDIWEFLQQNPRIASAIRMHNACVIADTKAKGYVGATLSISETIDNANTGVSNPLDHVKYLMRDHPVYAGIISLVSPALPGRSSVTRNERQRVSRIENYLSYRLYQEAQSGDTPMEAATTILDELGVTEKNLREAMRSKYDVYLSMRGLPTVQDAGESVMDADGIYDEAIRAIIRYINEIRQDVDLTIPINDGQAPRKPHRLGVDAMSCASFWDVVQELGGAKTAVSTGIEGYETYQFAEWASHISAKDRYADLEAVPDEDVDVSWNGMWTNVGIPLQVDESGQITNYDAIMQAKREQNLDEVVTMVPDGYTVRDRSTDSFGTQVASLFAYMVSKRSNGAEAFNLKAKKSGIDKEGSYGYDSVTKMHGKYRMTETNGKLSPANIEVTQEHLRDIAQRDGIDAAKAELANMMLQENSRIGYNDLTLSNYMSIADLMLIEGEDGNLYLRSLEMLFSAIKYRLGSKIDSMTDEQIRQAADQVVRDNTATGVGIAEMASPFDAVMGIRPSRKSTSVNGIRQSASVFERNYNLLANITENALTKYAVEPISQKEASDLNSKYRQVYGIKDVVAKSRVARNYNVVGYAAAIDGSSEIEWTVGPSNAIVIGEGNITNAEMNDIFERAYDLGMTVIVSVENRNMIPKEYIYDAMPCSDNGAVIVPCFDMRLNGSESKPYNGGRFATFQAPYSRYVTSVEDSVNEFELGDAQAKPTNDFTKRIKVVDSGSEQVKAEDMFPNVFRNPAYRHSSFTISLASGDEIASLIANGVKCTIDYGVVEGGRGFDQRVHDVNAAIERYQDRWSEADEDGIMRGDMTECHPGDIVGWAECLIVDSITGAESVVLAPIIPFPLHGVTKNIPETFSVQQLGYANDDNTLFSVDWSNTSEIGSGFAKYFDSSGGANKGMMNFADPVSGQRLLRDGTAVDVYIAKASTDSRKIGTDRRIKTMISLMALARMHGYNFAEVDGAFPNNPKLREQMLSGRVPASTWRRMLRGRDITFIDGDPKLNAFLNYECRKVLDNGGNPYDYLANTYTDADGNVQNTHVMWEFEAMFDQGLNYEDSLLHFLHTMDSTFCPNGIDDMGDYNFRLYRDASGSAAGYDNGVLQMQVPHDAGNGSMAYVWDNVYIGMSFFGEDYSGFSRPNVNGASNFLDAMNTMSYYGKQLDEVSARYRAMWATADIGRIPRDGGAFGKA